MYGSSLIHQIFNSNLIKLIFRVVEQVSTNRNMNTVFKNCINTEINIFQHFPQTTDSALQQSFVSISISNNWWLIVSIVLLPLLHKTSLQLFHLPNQNTIRSATRISSYSICEAGLIKINHVAIRYLCFLWNIDPGP